MAAGFANQAAAGDRVAEARAEATSGSPMLDERDQDRGRDLHDHAIQGIFSVGLTLNGLASRSSGPEAARLMELVDRLDDAIKAIRNSIFTLQLQETASPSLRAQLATVVMRSSTPLGFTPRFHTEGPVDTIVPPHVGDDLVAVLREALSNVARHARATRVEVVVSAGRAADPRGPRRRTWSRHTRAFQRPGQHACPCRGPRQPVTSGTARRAARWCVGRSP